MNEFKTPLERAFELARSGKYASVTDIKRRLAAERYDLQQVTGPALQKQLREVLQLSRMDTPRG